MVGFSNATLQVIKRFAGDIGIDAIPAADGSFSFEFSHSGLLSLNSSEDGKRVIVSLARQPYMPEAALELNFFLQAGYDPSTNRFRHAGLAEDGTLVGAISVDEHDFSISTLDESFQQLINMHEAVR